MFEDTLYVTLFDNTVVRMNKFSGEHTKVLLSAFTRVFDVVVMHPLKQTYNSEWR